MNKNIQLTLILSVFFTPFIAATILYFFESDFAPQTKNYGQLIMPPIATTSILENPDRRWRLVLLHPEICNGQCREQLYLIRQIRTSLGKYQQRIDYMLVSAQDLVEDADTLQLHPELLQVQLDVPVMGSLWQQVTEASQDLPILVLIDPLGNLLMQWQLNEQSTPLQNLPVSSISRQHAKGIISDIKHLLKVSRIG